MPRTPMTTAIHQVMTFGGLSFMLASSDSTTIFPVAHGVHHPGCPVADDQLPEW
jgi:hypothetical protein